MNETTPHTPERKLWYEGANYTADAIVLDDEATHLLLVQRNDTGEWALPGGFIDAADESSREAALREVEEETGATRLTGGDIVYHGVTSDRRSSPTAWIETSAHVFSLSRESELQAGDDAAAVAWHRLDDLPDLYGSHARLVARALDYERGAQLFDHIRGGEYFTPVDGGYMKYDKYIAESEHQFVFVKQQPDRSAVNPERWSDMHHYLEKEAGVMAHLRSQGYNHVPKQSIFRDGQLAMDALRAEDGWQWKANAESLDAYLTDTLAALAELETIPLPPDVFDVAPSYESVLREGWEAFDYDKLGEKIQELASHLPHERALDAYSLYAEIPELYLIAHAMKKTEPSVFCHLDMRQENLAWHPEHGVKIIDWSWAGPGLPGSDATSLLIDLHKNGLDVSRYTRHINKQHCLNLMGFWLAHSTLPNQGAEGLREQQFASAVSAYELLLQA